MREHLAERGVEVPLIAKIEKPQAAANGEEIIDSADGIMIARGDLGIELPIEEVPLVQKRLLALAGRRAKPTITATQMLESMVHSTRPTRAEVADVANAIFDGTDAVMLSQETAVGKHPVLAVEMMASIARDNRARASLRALARRARTAGEQPVPRDRLRRGGRRLPARAQVHRLADQHRDDGAADLGLPAQGARAGALARGLEVVRRCRLLWGVHPRLHRGAARHARAARGVRSGGRRGRLRREGRQDRDHRRAARPARPAAPTSSRFTRWSDRGAARGRPGPSRGCRTPPSGTSVRSGSSSGRRRPTRTPRAGTP